MLLAFSPPVPAGEFDSVAPPFQAPHLAALDLDRKPRSLERLRGNVVLINFWASWCAPCVREMPLLQRLQDVTAGQPFAVWTVNVAEPQDRLQRFVQRLGLTLPVLLDPESRAFNDWGVSVLPTSFLVDRQGRVRYRALGEVQWDSAEVHSVVQTLIAEFPQ